MVSKKFENKITLRDVIKKTNWKDVRNCFLQNYQNQKKLITGYEMVYKKLRAKTPSLSKMELFFEKSESDNAIEVFGRDGTLRDDGQLERFSLSLSSWSQWLGSSISEKALRNISNEEIVSYCLFDMTFYGFSESKIKQHKKELDNRYNDMKDPIRFIIISNLFERSKFRMYLNISDELWSSDIESATMFKREQHARLIMKAMSDKKDKSHFVAKITTKNGKRKIINFMNQ